MCNKSKSFITPRKLAVVTSLAVVGYCVVSKALEFLDDDEECDYLKYASDFAEPKDRDCNEDSCCSDNTYYDELD